MSQGCRLWIRITVFQFLRSRGLRELHSDDPGLCLRHSNEPGLTPWMNRAISIIFDVRVFSFQSFKIVKQNNTENLTILKQRLTDSLQTSRHAAEEITYARLQILQATLEEKSTTRLFPLAILKKARKVHDCKTYYKPTIMYHYGHS